MSKFGTLYIVSAPSGAGKSSLINALLDDTVSNETQLSVSHTTRDPRVGEVDGVHYNFVTTDQFKKLIEDQSFFEWAEVFGNYYGTSKVAIEEKLAMGIDVILDIDWQGARQVKKLLPQAKGIFILPPNLNELKLRLTKRGQDSTEVISKRMAQAQSEMSHYNEFDYIIVNDDFADAKQQFKSIIADEMQIVNEEILAKQNLIKELLA